LEEPLFNLGTLIGKNLSQEKRKRSTKIDIKLDKNLTEEF